MGKNILDKRQDDHLEAQSQQRYYPTPPQAPPPQAPPPQPPPPPYLPIVPPLHEQPGNYQQLQAVSTPPQAPQQLQAVSTPPQAPQHQQAEYPTAAQPLLQPNDPLQELLASCNFQELSPPPQPPQPQQPQLLQHHLQPNCNQEVIPQQQQQQQQQMALPSEFSLQPNVQQEAVTLGLGRGGGGGSQPLYTPPLLRCVGAVCGIGRKSFEDPSGELFMSAKRPRLECHGAPVEIHPDRSSFVGDFQFQVKIPGAGPNLFVTQPDTDEDDAYPTIFTKRGHTITPILTHTADPATTRHRFLLVHSKDHEASQPVWPCKNDRKDAHPKHMLEVKSGEEEAVVEWPDDPHPSVVVTVTPSPSATQKHTYQLTFLCRNSCVMRKDLMLLCQLEIGCRVVGRQVFKVKVCASPKRDSGPPARRLLSPAVSRGTISCPASSSPSPHVSALQDANTDGPGLPPEVTQAAKEMAQLVYVEKYFRENFPEQHKQASESFTSLWNVEKCIDHN